MSIPKAMFSDDIKIIQEHKYEIRCIVKQTEDVILYDCLSHYYKQTFFIERFPRNQETDEAKECLSCCDHPNIIRLYDHFSTVDYQYLVFEQYHQTLAEYIQTRGIPSYSRLVFLSTGIGDLLRYSFLKGIGFSKLEPSDFVIDIYGRIKYFGHSMQRLNKFTPKTYQSDHINAFLPPEAQSESFDPVPANIYSYGAILYYISLGRHPWVVKESQTLSEAIQERQIDTSPLTMCSKLGDVIIKCLSKNSKERLTIQQVLDMPFFTQNQLPKHVSADRLKFNLKRKSSTPSILLSPFPVPGRLRK